MAEVVSLTSSEVGLMTMRDVDPENMMPSGEEAMGIIKYLRYHYLCVHIRSNRKLVSECRGYSSEEEKGSVVAFIT